MVIGCYIMQLKMNEENPDVLRSSLLSKTTVFSYLSYEIGKTFPNLLLKTIPILSFCVYFRIKYWEMGMIFNNLLSSILMLAYAIASRFEIKFIRRHNTNLFISAILGGQFKYLLKKQTWCKSKVVGMYRNMIVQLYKVSKIKHFCHL